MFKLFFLSIAYQMTVAAIYPYLQIIFRNKGYSHSLCGLLIAIGEIATIIIPLVVSSLANKSGKSKYFIIGATLISSLLFIPFAFSNSVIIVLIVSALAVGIASTLNPMTDAAITRGLEGNSSKYGAVRSAGSMSYVVALTFFSLTGFPKEENNYSILLSILIAMAIMLIAGIILKGNDGEVKSKDSSLFSSLKSFPKKFWILMIVVAFSRFSQGAIDKLIPGFLTEDLGLGQYFTLFVALGALCEFFFMNIFGKLINKNKIKPWVLILISSLALSLRMLLYLLPGLAPIIIAQCLHGLTFGAFHVAVIAIISSSVDSSRYEIGCSIYFSLATHLPELLAVLSGGVIIDSLGYKGLFLIFSVFPLIASTLCFANRKTLN